MLSFFFSFFNIRITGDEIFNYKIFRADVSKKKREAKLYFEKHETLILSRQRDFLVKRRKKFRFPCNLLHAANFH